MSRSATHFYNHYITKLFNTDLHLFEFSVWLQAFAQALISVFVPIILWKLGLSLKQIVIFYLLFDFLDVPLNLVAKNLISRYGARTIVILAIFAELLYFVFLYNLHNSWIMIFFLALFLAIYDAFYWVGHLYIFSTASHKTSLLNSDVSTLKNFRILGGLVAPLVGAYILTFKDPNTLIFFSSLVMFGSLIPLFKMRHLKFIPEKASGTFKEFFQSSFEKKNYFFISLAALRQELEDVIWPFFLFFVFNSFSTVAFVPVVVDLMELVLITKIGKLSRKRNFSKLINFGAIGVLLLWVLRLFNYHNETFALISVAVVALLAIFIDIPLEINIFQRAHQIDELSAVTYMNLFRMLARGILYLVLFFFVIFWGTYFIASFYLIIALLLILAVSARIL
ncbi:MAG: hypothetical protein JWO40_365 [Candidatus Doudnabacteria bacterium]|nr:hypothetical protein [Candidatus Doudnabacteria bacterium]